MPHVTFVHGLANKPPADTLIGLWVDALARDNPRPQLHKKGNPGVSLDNLGATYGMVYWADVLYPSPDASIETQESYENENQQIEGISMEGAGAVERAAAEDTSWRKRLGPEEQRMLGKLEKELRFEVGTKESAAAAAAAATLERIPLPDFIKKPLMERLLRDLHHYFYNVTHSPRAGESFKVRDELQRRFIAAVAQVSDASRPHIVVSHSMGTVIAYDCIRNIGSCARIDALVTVGSPLGLDEVQDQLKNGRNAVDFPPDNIEDGWINVYDSLDPVVGFDARFANDFLRGGKTAVRDQEETNWGKWRHNIVKYLSGPKLREVLRSLLVPSIKISSAASRSTSVTPAPVRESRLESLAPAKIPAKQAQEKLTNAELSDLAKRQAELGDADLGKLADLMDELRRRRMFDEMLLMARAQGLQNAFASSPKLARLKGQALIENAKLDEAEAVLAPLADRRGDERESLEARGLLGRIAKQRYVNDRSAGLRSPEKLKLAIDRYLSSYAKSKLKEKPAWHGVNAAAMLRRAQRDGVRHKSSASAARIASTLIRNIERRFGAGAADFWDLATAGEAFLCAGKFDSAELWFRRYAEATDVEPFALASTIRQLQEIWGLSATQGPGRYILPPLEQALSRVAQTAIVSGDFVQEADAPILEKVFGNAAFISYEKMLLGLERCKAIGRVETAANDGFGTGFAIPGGSLSPKLNGAFVFVTNAHVISNQDPDALPPESAQVTFHALRGAKGRPFSTRFGKILKTSPPDKLDFTVLTLKEQPKKLQPYPIAPTLPSLSGKAQVYVIGHPLGGGLSFSLQDNKLVDHGAPADPRVHYRAPTEPGSSGSAVFNTSWELIALHHAGSASMQRIHGAGSYEANEGLWIQAILANIKGH